MRIVRRYLTTVGRSDNPLLPNLRVARAQFCGRTRTSVFSYAARNLVSTLTVIPARASILISLSTLKRAISPFSKLLIRGWVSRKNSAASACVQPRRLMYRRKSSIRSARTFKFAASPSANPRSSKTLLLPLMTLLFEDSFSRLPVNFLRRFVALPADRDILLGSFLSFLLECVEYIDAIERLTMGYYFRRNTPRNSFCSLLRFPGLLVPSDQISDHWY